MDHIAPPAPPFDRAALDVVLRAAGVDPATVASWERLGDATYNTAHRVRLADGSGLVLKIAPDPALPTMAYELGIMATEELFYRRAAAVVPVPRVVHADYSREFVGSDLLLMTELPGTNWRRQRDRITGADRTRLRTELGHLMAALHTVTGDGFGYPQRPLFSGWRAAFTDMLDLVLADACRYGVTLPWPIERIEAAVARHADTLDDVPTPVLVHFDLWEGNILVDDGALTGLVDGERAFWGDPVAELVSIALLGDIEDDPDFVAGYRAAGGTLTFDAATRARLAMYQTYLYSIMLVEGVPRGYTGTGRDGLMAIVTERLLAALTLLEG